jgi:hypothetical protein
MFLADEWDIALSRLERYSPLFLADEWDMALADKWSMVLCS